MSLYCDVCGKHHDCSVCPTCHGLGKNTKDPTYTYGPDKAPTVVCDMGEDPGYWKGAEYMKCFDDLRLYGCAFMRDGKRVDPRDVYVTRINL